VYNFILDVKVQATDADLMVGADHLEYYISSGNTAQNFVLDRRSGVLTVSKVEDMLDHYELSVKVTDGKYESDCIIQVSWWFL